MRSRSSSLGKNIAVLIWILFLVIIWELSAFDLAEIQKDSMAVKKLPYLHQVIQAMVVNASSLFGAAFVTFTRAAKGFLIGTCIGIVLAIVMSLHKMLEKMILPYIIVLQMIPVLALAPIVYSVVRSQDASRVVMSAFISFFPIAINMYAGLKSVDNEKKDLLYLYAANPIVVYRKLMFPFARPYLFTGLKLAAPSAITAAILVEMMGSDSGIGCKILSSLYYGNASALNFWASVLVAAMMGILSYYVMVLLEKLTTPGFLTRRKKGGNRHGKKEN